MNQEPSSTSTPQAMPGALSDALGTAQRVADQTQDTAGQVVGQVQDTAGQVAEQAKQQATSQLESQRERAVDTLEAVAEAFRQTGQHLRNQQQPAVGSYVEQAAERLERFSGYLRERDVPGLLAETQELARRNPGLFVAGALALGFVGARFLMSSGQRAAAQQPASWSPPPLAGHSGPNSTQTRAPYPGMTAARPLAPGPASIRTPAPWDTTPDLAPGVSGALDG